MVYGTGGPAAGAGVGLALVVALGVARGEPGLKVSDASATAVAGWKHPGVTVIAAGDTIAVAGVPLCQARNDRLLLWTSRPSVKVAWITSIRGSLLFEKPNVACPALSVVPLPSWAGFCGSVTLTNAIGTFRSGAPRQSTTVAVSEIGPGMLTGAGTTSSLI